MHGASKIKISRLIALSLLIVLIIISPAVFSTFRMRVVDLASSPLGILSKTVRLTKRAIPFASYREKIKKLRDEVDLRNAEISRLREYYAENRRLKELLGFKRELPVQTIPALVIGRDSSNWANSVIINKGTDHLIRVNAAVLTPRGLVGKVVEVGKASSKILLIKDPNSKVSVIIQKNRQGGLLVGRPDGKCKMIYISMDAEVSIGDRVITTGYGTIFPKGVMIGEVAQVGKEPGRLYKYAIVKPAQDLSKIEEVLCVK